MNFNKNSRIFIRITAEDKLEIEAKAKSLGCTSSQYIRDVVLNNKIITKTDVEMVFQVRKIGTNVNQIARLCNAMNVVSPDEIFDKFDGYFLELKDIIKKINS